MSKKKIILALSIFFVLAASIAVVIFENYRRGSMMGYRNSYANGRYNAVERMRADYSYLNYDQNNFSFPQDALKTGEIAATTNDVEGVKNQIGEIATQNEGIVYESNISYLANDIEKASIVLQLPVEKYDQALNALKRLNFKIMQESVKQVTKTAAPSANLEQVVNEKEAENGEVSKQSSAEASQSSQNEPESIENSKEIVLQPQIFIQDKGYIRLFLTNYGNSSFTATEPKRQERMMFFQNQPQDLSKVMWIAIGIKLALLLAMFCLLIFLSIRMITSFKKYRAEVRKPQSLPVKKKAVVHVIKKAPTNRRRIARNV